jgi:hypothetical protein
MKNKQKLVRNSLGRFVSPNKANIVNGRLYALDGEVVVRAEKGCQNGYFLVRYHKDLYGIVNPNRLTKISKKRVNKYLLNA